MYRQSMFTPFLSALALVLTVASVDVAGAAEADGQGGGGDTAPELHRACKAHAEAQKLTQAAAATFVQRCANAPINLAARKSGDKLRGTK